MVIISGVPIFRFFYGIILAYQLLQNEQILFAIKKDAYTLAHVAMS